MNLNSPTLNSAQLDPQTEQLIRKVVSAFLAPTQRGECKCHWIDGQKTPILMWKSPKDPDTMVMKISNQKFIGTTRTDKNNEVYWKFNNAYEDGVSAKQEGLEDKKTSVPAAPAQTEPEPDEKSSVESKEPKVDLPSPEPSPQVQKFQAKYGTASQPKAQ